MHSPISFKHLSLWCLFLDAHQNHMQINYNWASDQETNWITPDAFECNDNYLFIYLFLIVASLWQVLLYPIKERWLIDSWPSSLGFCVSSVHYYIQLQWQQMRSNSSKTFMSLPTSTGIPSLPTTSRARCSRRIRRFPPAPESASPSWTPPTSKL